MSLIKVHEMRFLAILMLLFSLIHLEGKEVIFESKSIKDWGGAVRKTTCKNGIFDTNKDLFVLVSKQKFPIKQGKTYRLIGDFKLKPYAPFGNIYFGFIALNNQGKAIRRVYAGESPYNDRVAPGNNQQVRNFWLTFEGVVPSKKFSFPKGTVAVQIIIHQFENYIVDMNFKNIKLIEE